MYGMYSPQYSVDRINEQINSLEKLKGQMNQNQPAINQTFQLAPNSQYGMKLVNNINEVQRELVFYDTPYFSKDMSVVWIKNTKGDIKTYELTEIIPKDEKDIQIEMLQAQIDELKKGMIVNEQYSTNADTAEVSTNTTGNDESIRTTIKENKPSSVSRVSTSKKR